MQKITPFLWFKDNAEEAINFYTGIFKNSKIVNVRRMPADGGTGGMITGTFEIEGQEFYVINGGPHYSFTPAISLFVHCKDQAEVDDLWEKLTKDGREDRCGWLTDKFGLSWQIIPDALGKLMGDPDPVKAKKVMNAMMQMKKIEVGKLQEAYDS